MVVPSVRYEYEADYNYSVMCTIEYSTPNGATSSASEPPMTLSGTNMIFDTSSMIISGTSSLNVSKTIGNQWQFKQLVAYCFHNYLPLLHFYNSYFLDDCQPWAINHSTDNHPNYLAQ